MDASSGTSESDVGPGIGGLGGTYSGGFTLNQTGIPGTGTGEKAVLFNGSTGKMVTAASDASGFPDTTLNVKWAVEVWGLIPTLPSGAQYTFVSSGTTGNFSWRLGELDNSGTQEWITVTIQNSGGCTGSAYGLGIPSSPAPAANVFWYLVMQTTGAGSGGLSHQTLYVNASQADDQTSFSGTFSGCGAFPMNAAWSGVGLFGAVRVDEYAVYQGGLTPTQITNHYNAGIFVPASAWPYTVRRPTVPKFLNPDYFDKLVKYGYHTGQFTREARMPQFIGFYPTFDVVPAGNVK